MTRETIVSLFIDNRSDRIKEMTVGEIVDGFLASKYADDEHRSWRPMITLVSLYLAYDLSAQLGDSNLLPDIAGIVWSELDKQTAK